MILPPAIILVGGLGTRLRTVVADRPKPLALVRGKPFLVHILEWLAAQGICEIVLCTGYKADFIRKTIGSGADYGLRIKYTIERELLGTGGAVAQGLKKIKTKDAFVLNGDSFVDISLPALFARHQKTKAQFTMTIIPCREKKRYGGLTRNQKGWVKSFKEKGENAPYMNAGVYCVSQKLRTQFPRQKKWSLEHDFFTHTKTKKVMTYLSKKAHFIDIGVPKDYKKVQNFFKFLD